jgi:hypothetical protein
MLTFHRLYDALIGLRVNGQAHVIDGPAMAVARNGDSRAPSAGSRSRWRRTLSTAGNIPRMVPAPRQRRAWGTDDVQSKGGDYFGAACQSSAQR